MSVIPGRRDKGKEGAWCITPMPGNPQKTNRARFVMVDDYETRNVSASHERIHSRKGKR